MPTGTHPKHFANIQVLMGTTASHNQIALQDVSHRVTVSEVCSLYFALYNKYHWLLPTFIHVCHESKSICCSSSSL